MNCTRFFGGIRSRLFAGVGQLAADPPPQDEPGFWEGYGYHNHGDPWKEQRYCND